MELILTNIFRIISETTNQYKMMVKGSHCSQEHRAKIAAYRTGKKHTMETKTKIAEALRGVARGPYKKHA